MSIRTLIVDRESRWLTLFSTLLAMTEDFEVVGECSDAESAAEALVSTRPDLVFLDQQLLAGSFDDVPLRELSQQPGCILVGSDPLCLPAIPMRPLDCLPKPFPLEHLMRSLQRARERLGNPAASAQGNTLVTTNQERLIVKQGRQFACIPLEDIEFIAAAANYVQFQLVEGRARARERISEVQALLPGEHFLRVHRSYIVNARSIRKLYPVGGGEYMIALRKHQLPVGSTYLHVVRKALRNLQRGGMRIGQ